MLGLELPGPPEAPMVNRIKMFWRRFRANRLALVGGGIVLVVSLVALLAPVLAPAGYTVQDLSHRRALPSLQYPLGTDELGRSVLDRLIWGARISIVAGVVSVAIGSVFGVVIGLVSAYFGGRIDLVLMRIVDIMLAVPFFLWAIVVVSALGSSLFSVMVAIGTWAIPSYARLVRSQALSERENLYVEGARAVGVPDSRIMMRHILPNVMGTIIVETSLRVGLAILMEAALSFLGLGVPAPEPSWGTMLLGGRPYMRLAPLVSVFPGLAIVITVLGFNLLGDGLRDVLDPKSGRSLA